MTVTDLHPTPRPFTRVLRDALTADLKALLAVTTWTLYAVAWVAPRLARFGRWLNHPGPAQVAVIAALVVVAIGPPALRPLWHLITG
jgi:hypothetical protein